MILIIIGSCIDRIDSGFDENDQGILVVDGIITDQSGPYEIRLFRSANVDDNLNLNTPFPVRTVSISDNLGYVEELVSKGDGVYYSDANGIRGEIGRKYKLTIVGLDGTIYESTMEEMLPSGEIDSLYFQWEEFKPLTGQTEYGFRVFLNSTGSDNGYIRWKYSGTYEVQTYPELRLMNEACQAPPDPEPCSGVVLSTSFSDGFVSFFLETVRSCSCCICWAKEVEKEPKLNDKILTDGTFKSIEIGYVPFDQWTFRFRKFMIKVEQMSLSKEAFEFWKIIRDQKEGSSSLFQPAFGRVRSNMISSNPNRQVTGLFYASSVTQKTAFIRASDAPISVPPPDINPPDNCFLWRSCLKAFPNSSNVPPLEWED